MNLIHCESKYCSDSELQTLSICNVLVNMKLVSSISLLLIWNLNVLLQLLIWSQNFWSLLIVHWRTKCSIKSVVLIFIPDSSFTTQCTTLSLSKNLHKVRVALRRCDPEYHLISIPLHGLIQFLSVWNWTYL